MESPSDFYCKLEKLRIRIGDLGYNLLKLIEEYQRAGLPFGETGEGFRIWVQYVQWTYSELSPARLPDRKKPFPQKREAHAC